MREGKITGFLWIGLGLDLRKTLQINSRKKVQILAFCARTPKNKQKNMGRKHKFHQPRVGCLHVRTRFLKKKPLVIGIAGSLYLLEGSPSVGPVVQQLRFVAFQPWSPNYLWLVGGWTNPFFWIPPPPPKFNSSPPKNGGWETSFPIGKVNFLWLC